MTSRLRTRHRGNIPLQSRLSWASHMFKQNLLLKQDLCPLLCFHDNVDADLQIGEASLHLCPVYHPQLSLTADKEQPLSR